MVHIHLHHVHQRCQGRDVEVLDVVARRLLGSHEEYLVVAIVETARLRVAKDVVLTIDFRRQFRHDLYRLQELIYL